MNWLRHYRIHHYLQTSIWVPPVLSMLVALVAVRLIYRVDVYLHIESDFHPDAVRSILTTLASCIFTLIVFVSSALLLAVQLASAQLTPRIIALVFRSTATKISLSIFVFTFCFSLGAVVRI